MNEKNAIKLVLLILFVIFISSFFARIGLSECGDGGGDEPPGAPKDGTYTGVKQEATITTNPTNPNGLPPCDGCADQAKKDPDSVKPGTYFDTTTGQEVVVGPLGPERPSGGDGGGGGSCGNGVIDTGEECDPPGQTRSCTVDSQTGSQTCNNNCLWGTCSVNPITGCGNGVCGQGETQENCCNSTHRDCCTVVWVTPDYVLPNQNVVLTIKFSDSRYSAGSKVNFNLLIDNTKEWLNPECISNMNITPPAGGCTGCGCSKSGMEWICGSGNKMNITSTSAYFFRVDVECKMPEDIVSGYHAIKATPTIYSKEIKLKSAETKIVVRENKDLILMIIRFFSELIGKLK
jgi:hypothetical protein